MFDSSIFYQKTVQNPNNLNRHKRSEIEQPTNESLSFRASSLLIFMTIRNINYKFLDFILHISPSTTCIQFLYTTRMITFKQQRTWNIMHTADEKIIISPQNFVSLVGYMDKVSYRVEVDQWEELTFSFNSNRIE